MRIRKHARLSSPSIATAPPDTQVCQLNRSPWDVISFNTSPKSKTQYQVKIEGNNYSRQSVGKESEPVSYAPESAAYTKEPCWEKASKKEQVEEVYDEMEEEEEEERRLFLSALKKKGKKKMKVKREPDYVCCSKTDGKGWHCKNEAKEGELLCEHHIIQLQSYIGKYSQSTRKSNKVKAGAPKPQAEMKTVVAANKKRNKARVSSASPADFYYYSGFGPSWRKKRTEENEINNKDMAEDMKDVDATDQASSSVVHVSHENDHIDPNFYHGETNHIEDEFYDDDDDDDDEEESNGKKRIRRPVKARSLNSLF